MLRMITYYTKIFASTSGELSSLAWVRIRESGLYSIIVVDEAMNIISGDESFWTVLKMVGFVDPVRNLSELSESICTNINLMKFL